ncbi:OmpA family protein [Flavobacterium microcysteis]|uniref:Cell envelope biogenesis protein OmpA n=1 Tax=Flavobacterium microcysteis TaxID=2596891 RepID=A0A501QHG0_9FLAO|nr:OmpA family protein [Flavobacterium microcysteis]TPD71874.1 cell envelope biogenesis protein OmpA [Flavobacterium microcysteis]
MKNLYITLSFVIASMTLSAQNKDTEKADKLFNRFEYVDASNEYLKLIEKGKADNYVYKQLADSYYNVFNTKEAIKWYAKATQEKQDAETYYRYAQMLKAEGKYEESNAQMQKFASMSPNDQRAVAFKQDPNYLPKLKSQTKLFDEKSLDINSDQSDFGAVLTNDNTLYFASARNKSRKTYGWNEEPFLDLYKSTYNANGTFSEPVTVSEINTKFHDGPASITADGNTMYFASESFKEGDFEKDKSKKLKFGQVYLFKATKEGDKWSNVKALPFNSKEYSVSNPSISKDGKTLYFSSNMPGSLGGNDIWKVAVNADGGFGTPENLGSKVNTEGNESFPFITDDNRLFFSSDGRKGFGGLDVFVIDFNKKTDAINVGAPVNTSKDDFAFTFNTAKNIGFFSSNRTGNDNIYQATPVCGVEVVTIVKDAKTGAILSDARVAILDEKKNVIETRTTAADGQVVYSVDCNKAYTLQVAKDGYESNVFPVAKTNGGIVNVNAELQPIDVIVTPTEIVLKEIFFEFNKSNITQEGAFELDKLVQVMKNNDQLVIMVKSHTDNRGSDAYNLNLSDRRAKSTVQYVISKGIDKSRISGKGYGESEPKVDCKENCTEEDHAKNRRSEFLIVKK